MRHRNSGRKLGRTSAHRKAMYKNMASALLTYGRITTTEAKAKEIRIIVEPLINLTKSDTLHARRQAYRVLGNHKLVKRLFSEIGPLFKDMDKGGYTRIAKLALPRKGDSAPMAIIELVKGPHYPAEEVAEAPKAAAKKPSKKEDAPAAADAAEEKKPAKKTAAAKDEKAKEAKPKAKAAPKPKSDTKSSKVADAKPKSSPRKMGG